jgi:hypothetical protein
MTNILAIVILSGASCISPVENSDVLKMTVVGKVPCAVVIREPVANPFKATQQPNTITPAAATKPPAFKYPKKKSKKKRKKR